MHPWHSSARAEAASTGRVVCMTSEAWVPPAATWASRRQSWDRPPSRALRQCWLASKDSRVPSGLGHRTRNTCSPPWYPTTPPRGGPALRLRLRASVGVQSSGTEANKPFKMDAVCAVGYDFIAQRVHRDKVTPVSRVHARGRVVISLYGSPWPTTNKRLPTC